LLIRWEHHALVDLPNAYQVTTLMIRVGGTPAHNNPTRGCYQADEEVGEALKILLQAGADIHRRAAKV
jgi:hypothetical protein